MPNQVSEVLSQAEERITSSVQNKQADETDRSVQQRARFASSACATGARLAVG